MTIVLYIRDVIIKEERASKSPSSRQDQFKLLVYCTYVVNNIVNIAQHCQSISLKTFVGYYNSRRNTGIHKMTALSSFLLCVIDLLCFDFVKQTACGNSTLY